MKAFFSYASEDGEVVEQVYRRVATAFPQLKPWLDKYEIVAGDELLEKIGEAIGTADKFFVFLSQRSVSKRWVRAELRMALTEEIKGAKPDFVVPVKLGEIEDFPPFIESKRYIDLSRLSEAEWLGEFEAVIVGKPPGPEGDAEPNLVAERVTALDVSEAGGIKFSARYWAEDVGFLVKTNAKILEATWRFLDRPLTGPVSVIELKEDFAYGVRLPNDRLLPGLVFAMLVRFPPGTNPGDAIVDASRWDGGGGSGKLAFF